MRFRIVLQSVTLGAVTNVVVAWGCSALASHIRVTLRYDQVVSENPNGKYQLASAALLQSPGMTAYSWVNGGYWQQEIGQPKYVSIGDDRVPAWSCIRLLEVRESVARENQVWPFIDWRTGWPLATLRGRLTPETLGASHERVQCREGMLRFRYGVSRVWATPRLWVSGHLFPLIPVWPGVAVNTLVYAGVWGVVLIAVLRLRAWRRKKQSRCGRCGYELRGLEEGAVCPECGRER